MRWATVIVFLVLAGCGSSEPDATSAPPTEDPSIQVTEDSARSTCADRGATAIAAEFDVDDATDLDAVARAYADEVSQPGPHAEASYRGCLAGFTRGSEPTS